MLGRAGLLLACVLGPGCMPTADAPVPAPPPKYPQPVIDRAGAPPEGGARAEGGASSEEGASPKEGAQSPVSVAPEPIPVEINERYADKTDPEHWVGRFEREGREVFDHREQIIAALGLRPGQRVADVGAGTGLFTLELARVVGKRGKVYAVDVQAYFLDHIAQKARKQKLGNVEVVRARQDSVQLPPGSVELVLMCDAYHHVEQPAAYLESLRTALEPGGRLVVVDYRAVEGQIDPWMLDHVRATPQEFRAEIEKAGFRFIKEHEGLLAENFFYEFERP